MRNIKYYKIPNRDVVIEPYFDEYFHECRRGAWTIKDAITNEQFYFNGTNSTYYERSLEKLLEVLYEESIKGKLIEISDEEFENIKMLKELIK